jgi:glycosyltransferase involved in cell wall biosynthesis
VNLRIVIPAYNEASRIASTLTDYCTEFRGIATVVVVATGCSDGTADVVRAAQPEFDNLELIETSDAIGKGGAVRVGLTTAREEYVGFTDADGSTRGSEFARLFEILRSSNADALVASRWLPSSVVAPRQPPLRRAASRTFNAIVRALFGLRIRDTQCGTKLFRTSALDRVRDDLELSGFAFDIELLVALRSTGATIDEVPTTWSDRATGSKIRLATASWSMLKSVARLRLRASPLRRVPFIERIGRSDVILSSALPVPHAGGKLASGTISIVMPAFNECDLIARNIREVVATFEQFNADFEVILVDDGSHDNTYLHALAVLVDHPERVRILRYDLNQGKGNALMAGAAAAKGEYVVFLDSDMDIHPSQLPVFFEIMQKTGASAVIGSKRHPLSRVKYPPIRQIYSTGYYALVRLLFGLPLRDTQTGLKLFRAEVLRDVLPRVLAKRFAFDIEVLSIAHYLGYRIVDAPVVLGFSRKYGRINYREAWRIFLDTLAIFYRLRLLHYYDTKRESYPLSGTSVRELSPADAGQLVKQ